MASATNASYQRLVHQLSERPPTTCKSHTVDFEKVGLPTYKDRFAMLIDDILSPEECKMLLQVAQQENQWEQALVNIGAGQQKLFTDVRLCERIIWDDQAIADKIMARVQPYLPENIVTLENNSGITGLGPVRRKEQWRILRLNERLRFLRYTRGHYFRQHCDGSYETPERDLTFLTVHLYLNGGGDSIDAPDGEQDDSKKPLVGGATRFFGRDEGEVWDVNPKMGSVIIFQHRHLYHSGEEVDQGTKYTLRSDVLYRKV